MRSFLFAFFTSLIGGVCITAVVLALRRYEPRTTADFSQSEVLRYGRSLLLKSASVIVVTGWLFYLLALGAIPAAVISAFTGAFQTEQALMVFLFSFGATIVSSFLYTLHAVFLRCAKCSRRLTVQWTKEPPKFSRKVWFLRGWGALILDVLINKKFRCMYCGQWYLV